MTVDLPLEIVEGDTVRIRWRVPVPKRRHDDAQAFETYVQHVTCPPRHTRVARGRNDYSQEPTDGE